MNQEINIGTGQTRKAEKRSASAEIEELPSEQLRPYRSPAFNPGDIVGGGE